MNLAQVTGISNPSTEFNDYSTLPADIMSRVALFAVSLAGFYFLYRLIVAGYAFMSSMGEDAKLQVVRQQLTNAALGLLIVVCAFFIMQIVGYLTGASIL